MTLLDMHYSRDSAPPTKGKLCVGVDGLRICILEDRASGQGNLMTCQWHLLWIRARILSPLIWCRRVNSTGSLCFVVT